MTDALPPLGTDSTRRRTQEYREVAGCLFRFIFCVAALSALVPIVLSDSLSNVVRGVAGLATVAAVLALIMLVTGNSFLESLFLLIIIGVLSACMVPVVHAIRNSKQTPQAGKQLKQLRLATPPLTASFIQLR